mgnify:FL=1
MFSTDDFQAWGKDNAILFAAVMTKIEGRKDDALLRTYEFRGFPSMAVLDASANAVTKSIPRDLQSMQRIVAATPGYVKLAAAVDAGEDVNASEWFLARLRLGKLTSAEAKEQLAEAGLSGDAKEEAQQSMFVLEMTELSKAARRRDASAEDKMAACEAVYAAFKTGRRLHAGAPPEAFVDDMLIDAAKSNGDKAAFGHAYERVKQRHMKRIKDMEGFKARYEADVEKFKDDEQKRERAKSTVGRIEQIMGQAEEQLQQLEALAKKMKS